MLATTYNDHVNLQLASCSKSAQQLTARKAPLVELFSTFVFANSKGWLSSKVTTKQFLRSTNLKALFLPLSPAFGSNNYPSATAYEEENILF
jgi:hypothetical protein